MSLVRVGLVVAAAATCTTAATIYSAPHQEPLQRQGRGYHRQHEHGQAQGQGQVGKEQQEENEEEWPRRILSHSDVSTIIADLYEPTTMVLDQSALDRDLFVLHELLWPLVEARQEDDAASESMVQQASRVYSEGGHSQPYSELYLTNPPVVVSSEWKRGTVVTNGVNNDNVTVEGTTLFAAVGFGSTPSSISVAYDANRLEAPCNVGGLPSKWWIKEGCLKDTAGSRVVIGGQALDYTSLNHVNGLSLALLSQKRSVSCTASPSCMAVDSISHTYFAYYGEYDYGHVWIMAALRAKPTFFARGNVNFAQWPLAHRMVMVDKATVVLNLWMHVIEKLQQARDAACHDTTTTTNTAHHWWDQAVAFYTGSQVATRHDHGGVFLYGLADQLCDAFDTCVQQQDAASKKQTRWAHVNQRMFQFFAQGRHWLYEHVDDFCGNADQRRKLPLMIGRMVSFLTVPLVQGLLRSAFYRQQQQHAAADEDDDPKEDDLDSFVIRAQGTTFLAALLPQIYACDKALGNGHGTAVTLYQAMHAPTANLDDGLSLFDTVKLALEANYECLGITCAMVGNLQGANNTSSSVKCPAKSDTTSSSSSPKSGHANTHEKPDDTITATIVVVHVLFILVVVAVMGWYMLRHPITYSSSSSSSDADGAPLPMRATTPTTTATVLTRANAEIS